ncbi:MAG: DNA repair protein RadA, partial [Parachlamydiales bacterium]
KEKTKALWECLECGHTQPKWTGACSACSSWNSFVEQRSFTPSLGRFQSQNQAVRPIPITEISTAGFNRLKTNFSEVDRLLGGGLVVGSLNLIGGEPGIGKSTFLLQLANALAVQNKRVLYVCGEESADQTALRAQRLQAQAPSLYLLNETLFEAVKNEIDQLKPEILIIDSIQILYKAALPSAPGSVVQVRELATEFMLLAKGQGITTFLIGHVTKTGDLAGPRVLEHIVDTVLEFEGDRQSGFRLLRSVKNRFGSTDDIALFQMKEAGLMQIANLSEAFLKERKKKMSGSVIAATIEGIRAMLIEVQALVTKSPFPSPYRRSAGLDQNRLALLLAVLEKKLGYHLYNMDVFVSLAGGLKILEPGLDLAVLIAIASSFVARPLKQESIVLGEVGLGGEVRSVYRLESRLNEALNLGFSKALVPKKNLKDLSSSYFSKLELKGVESVEEAIGELL